MASKKTTKISYFCEVKVHEKYMARCIELAKNGLGTTYPNPLVGAVIVYDGKIIGEGWHRKSGEPHAEVLAIQSVKDATLLAKSTIYVSLEPCSHFGKTPPCADLILEHNIPEIVIGTVDPNVKVAGKGIAKLEAAGRKVTVGVLENDCNDLNKRFFTFHQKKRPYIILKWAQSADGFVAPLQKNERKPVWITNEFSRQLVHKWRAEEQAILVGTQTVVADNPTLDVRDWTGENPTRIVLDQNNRISKESHIFGNQSKTLVYSEPENFSDNVALALAGRLYRDGIQSVIIEGGTRTLETFLLENLWDEARIFKGTNQFGNGVLAPKLPQAIAHRKMVLQDELLIFYNHD
jgi:diaminohydroxyphosphoribosylaminopyrimidine deaminase / 5-amino-6-(5-phosphoribosylamino)uracil reductase